MEDGQYEPPKAHEDGRRLVDSSLWKEDVHVLGHDAVWGSWYDATAKRWGYACCRLSERSAPCDSTRPVETQEPNSSDDSADPSDGSEERDRPFDWSSPPSELLSREVVLATGEPHAFIAHFVRFMVGAWRGQLDGVADVSGSVVDTPYKERKSLEQVESALSPLIQQIERQAANSSVILQLDKMVRLAAERRYADAGAAYMQLALGNKKWNNTLASYGGASGTNKGARIYITKQDDLLEYDKDPVVQRYVQGMRKLVHFAQVIRPAEDSSQRLST